MTHSNSPPCARCGLCWTFRPSFLVVLVTVSFSCLLVKPAASLFLLQSFPNSSLWRQRYLGSNEKIQKQQDYYEILGVRRNANQNDIKTAFRQLVKQYHPDANPDTDTTDQFQKINKAYQTLSDNQRRRRYNSQTYHHGLSSDTPNFIIDALEDEYQPQERMTTATTDATRYKSLQLEPNENGRGSLLKSDEEEDGTNGKYRIRSL